MRRPGCFAAGLLLAATLTVPVAAAARPAASGPTVRLSDQRRTTVVAEAGSTALVHREASGSAPTFARLRRQTEDQLPELYLVLAQKRVAGKTWVRVALPARPNGQTGWVPRSALRAFRTVHTLLVVDLAARRLTLFERGRRIFAAAVGVGAPGTPTPRGHFWIRDHFRILNNAFYGPYAIGTSDYSDTLTDWPGGGVIGIHGTDQPQLIPGNPSHGCIRLRDRDLERLFWKVPLGTPLWIR